MDNIEKIYKIIELYGVSALKNFIDEANKNYYELISVVCQGSVAYEGASFVVIYKDYK